MSLKTRKPVRLERKAFETKRFEMMVQICNTWRRGLDWHVGVDAA